METHAFFHVDLQSNFNRSGARIITGEFPCVFPSVECRACKEIWGNGAIIPSKEIEKRFFQGPRTISHIAFLGLAKKIMTIYGLKILPYDALAEIMISKKPKVLNDFHQPMPGVGIVKQSFLDKMAINGRGYPVSGILDFEIIVPHAIPMIEESNWRILCNECGRRERINKDVDATKLTSLEVSFMKGSGQGGFYSSSGGSLLLYLTNRTAIDLARAGQIAGVILNEVLS